MRFSRKLLEMCYNCSFCYGATCIGIRDRTDEIIDLLKQLKFIDSTAVRDIKYFIELVLRC